MSLILSWNRDLSKDREFGRDVSSVRDVSSSKPKTVCTFYCFNFLLMCLLISVGFLPNVCPETSSMQKNIIIVDNPICYFFGSNYCSLWKLFLLASFIDSSIYLSSYIVWLFTKWLRKLFWRVSPILWSTATNGYKILIRRFKISLVTIYSNHGLWT